MTTWKAIIYQKIICRSLQSHTSSSSDRPWTTSSMEWAWVSWFATSVLSVSHNLSYHRILYLNDKRESFFVSYLDRLSLITHSIAIFTLLHCLFSWRFSFSKIRVPLHPKIINNLFSSGGAITHQLICHWRKNRRLSLRLAPEIEAHERQFHRIISIFSYFATTLLMSKHYSSDRKRGKQSNENHLKEHCAKVSDLWGSWHFCRIALSVSQS